MISRLFSISIFQNRSFAAKPHCQIISFGYLFHILLPRHLRIMFYLGKSMNKEQVGGQDIDENRRNHDTVELKGSER